MAGIIQLTQTKRTDHRLLIRMSNHYSHPKGFVGRNICYAITYNNVYYGHIVGGSATRNLPGRNEFLNVTRADLNKVVNNIFFNVSPPADRKYPLRNFTSSIVKVFIKKISKDWLAEYGDPVVGFETLIELPRAGELYRRAGWTNVGTTKGYTCKRTVGYEFEGYRGERVWDYVDLRPKAVWCYKSC